jgi:hypothetical protein
MVSRFFFLVFFYEDEVLPDFGTVSLCQLRNGLDIAGG